MPAASRKCPLFVLQRDARKSNTSVYYAEGTHLFKLKESLKKKKAHRSGSSSRVDYCKQRLRPNPEIKNEKKITHSIANLISKFSAKRQQT
jgi:hypothetical protein